MQRRAAPSFATALLALGCASGPPGSPAPGAGAAPAEPAPPAPTLLLAPIDTQGVAEPARSRASSVEDAVESFLEERGFGVERIGFDAYRALLTGAGNPDPHEGIVKPRLVQTTIEVRGSPRWDGVSHRVPTRGLSRSQYPARLRAYLEVLSLEIEIVSSDGTVLHRGRGGLDHLQQLHVDSNRFSYEPWPKTLTRRRRIDEGVAVALESYSPSP